jgi:hypothetical protein
MIKKLDKAIRNPSRLEIIIAHVRNPGEVMIDADLERVLDRFRFMDGLIRKYFTLTKCMEQQMTRFPDISENTAKNDYYQTMQAFDSDCKPNKKYERELARQMLKDQYVKADEAGDSKTAIAAAKALLDSADKQLEEVQQQEVPQPTIIVVADDAAILGRDVIPYEELVRKTKEWERKKKKGNTDSFEEAEEV